MQLYQFFEELYSRGNDGTGGFVVVSLSQDELEPFQTGSFLSAHTFVQKHPMIILYIYRPGTHQQNHL